MNESKSETAKNKKLLLGVTGSVAAIKIPNLIEKLQQLGFEIRLVVTKNALNFISVNSLSIPVYTDDDEWSSWKEHGDSVLHIQLRNWADILLIAPMSANSLAKMSCGIADNLLTTIVRAWWWWSPPSTIDNDDNNSGVSIGHLKPVYFAPAMNTAMWHHPFTSEQIERLTEKLHWKCIQPIKKKLFCGDIGIGAMAEVEEIVNCVKPVLEK
ncbi:unnamed protein product [Trichobilharzia szidati]|nr:unnamed protein product [Trichobilharzia szidati]